jgi:hypothetical protein
MGFPPFRRIKQGRVFLSRFSVDGFAAPYTAGTAKIRTIRGFYALFLACSHFFFRFAAKSIFSFDIYVV